MSVNVTLPAWAKAYNDPTRYKVAYGGRGSAKSWTFARLILLKAVNNPIRVLCAREIQASIRDSVHAIFADQIVSMGLSDFFSVGESFIRSNAGAEFLFKGLRHNTTEIKSMEGVDICWVEEAQGVSDSSWEILIPTIRKPGSEIWISFNPLSETDPTYRRFVTTHQPDSIVKKINYSDNPWFPAELEKERLHCLKTDPDSYSHIWEGACKAYSKALVLINKWRVGEINTASWNGPYHGADWGFTDPTTLVKCWIKNNSMYVEFEAYQTNVAINKLDELFKLVPHSKEHKIRADNARPELINHMASDGWKIEPVKKWQGSVEDGVQFFRGLDEIVIHPRCVNAIREAGLWRFKVDKLTNDVLPVLVDADNHVMDAMRYAIEPMIKRTKVLDYSKLTKW